MMIKSDMSIPQPPAPSENGDYDNLVLGNNNPLVAIYKGLLHIAGFWGDKPIDTVVDGEVLYWSEQLFPQSTGFNIKELIGLVKDYLNEQILVPPNVPSDTVKSSQQNTPLPLIINGGVNLAYLVPQRVISDPVKAYGTFSDTKMKVVDLPFNLRLSWDLSTSVQRLNVNALMAEDFLAAMNEILYEIGYSDIAEVGLDITGGCYNRRKVRGGTSWSSHSWGTAIDINPTKNRMGAKPGDTLFGVSATYQRAAAILYRYGFRTLKNDLQHWQHVPSKFR